MRRSIALTALVGFDSDNSSDVVPRKPDPWFCRPECVLALICRLARGAASRTRQPGDVAL